MPKPPRHPRQPGACHSSRQRQPAANDPLLTTAGHVRWLSQRRSPRSARMATRTADCAAGRPPNALSGRRSPGWRDRQASHTGPRIQRWTRKVQAFWCHRRNRCVGLATVDILSGIQVHLGRLRGGLIAGTTPSCGSGFETLSSPALCHMPPVVRPSFHAIFVPSCARARYHLIAANRAC